MQHTAAHSQATALPLRASAKLPAQVPAKKATAMWQLTQQVGWGYGCKDTRIPGTGGLYVGSLVSHAS